MDERDPIERLTEREREALRGWLHHKTAKEIALDLGISHYAVEKRLKTARLKLGVATSLEAARQLAASEGYGPAVAQTADLAPPAVIVKTWPTRLRYLGAIVVITILAAVLTLAVQAPPRAEQLALQDTAQPAGPRTAASPRELPPGNRAASMCEVGQFLAGGFGGFDTDGSGSMEPQEVARLEPKDQYRDPSIGPAPAAGDVDQPAIAKWMPMLDTDRDGLVSQSEYVTYMMPWILWQGVPEAWINPDPARCQG